MSTQIVLGVVGAAVGGFVGGPFGAQVGYAIGSVAGSIIDPQQISGPRLSELNVALSSYGSPIPRLWGGIRVACPPIWAAPLIERRSTERAGKGGPETTTYSYYASFAVSIAEGEVTALRRIWLDAKLVYDVSDGASAETALASAEFANLFTFYQGTEDQLQDPTIEAYEGTGNVEAYRGTAYLVFTDLPLANYGNRIPQVRVEVTSAEPDTEQTEYFEPRGVRAWRFNPVSGVPEHTPPDPADTTAGAAEYYVEAPSVGGGGGPYTSLAAALAVALANGDNSTSGAGGNASADQYITFYTGNNSEPNVFEGGAELDESEWVFLVFGTVIPDVITSAGNSDAYVGCGSILGAGQGPYSSTVIFSRGSFIESVWRGLVSASAFDGAEFINNCFLTWPGLSPIPAAYGAKCNIIAMRRVPECDSKRCFPGNPSDQIDGIAEAPGDPRFCIATTGETSPNGDLNEYADTSAFKQLNEDIYTGSVYPAGTRTVPAQGPIIHESDPRYTDATFWAQAALAAVYPPPGVYSSTGTGGDGTWPVLVSTVCRAQVDSLSVAAGQVALSAIVTDLCLESGLAAEQFDVTDLTDMVQGYARPRVMSARAAIEPLRATYFFDAVESGALIRFVKRGGAQVASLDAGELGAAIDAAVEPVTNERTQETELPSYVGVAYQSRAADYQTAVQQSRRRAGGSQQIWQIDAPIVLPDDYAAQVAEILLYDAWVSRVRRSFTTSMKYAELEPTDVVALVVGDQTYRVRITERVEDRGVLKFTAVDEDADVFDSVAAGATPPGGSSGIRYDGPTLLVAMDAPLLREEDLPKVSGYYAAATGYSDNWRGAEVFSSLDSGASYSGVGTLDTPAVVGSTLGALGNFTGGNLVDECNTVDVVLAGGGSLSSATRAQLLQNGNAAWLAGEVIQFRTATLISTGTYRLSGLLRGRLGTEEFMATHAVNDRFVLLEAASVRRIAAASSLWGVAQTLKGVTFGTALTSAYEVPFTAGGHAARPLSPVHLAVAPRAAGGYAASWVRRTRYGYVWADSRDAALGESVESYRLRVLDGSTVMETATATTGSAVFGTVGSPDYTGLVCEVCQVSDIYGPGAAATALIP